MRFVVLFMCGLLGSVATEEVPQSARTIELAIRHVNEEVITFGDLMERIERMRSQGRLPTATSMEEVLAIWRDQLEELTVDNLLVQFADDKGVLIDSDRINQKVRDDAQRSGRGLNLVDMARSRKRLERAEKIGAALSFFDLRSASISPGELLDAYARRKDSFKRPASAHVLQIVLRPTDPAERAALKDDQSAMFRRAQDVDPSAAAVVAPLLERMVALDPESGERADLLDQAMVQLAALPIDANSAEVLRDLVDRAAKLVQRRTAQRTPSEIEAQMAALRAQLDGKGVEAFKTCAKAVSQGQHADAGGDLGSKEPGFFSKELDAAIFALKAGELSQPIWSQQACCLTLVSERVDAAQRSFAEVTGELERILRQERQLDIRTKAAGVLRARAVVRDLASLTDLIRSGGG